MFKRFFNDLRKYFPYSLHFAKSRLKTEVAGSYLGWIWWLLNPICFMMVYTVVFGVIFEAREKYMSLFIFVGLTLFNFFSTTTKKSVKIIASNKSILRKVYLPKFMLIISQMLINGFKMLISFGLIVVMMIFFRIPPSFRMLWIIPILVLLILVTYAVSILLLHCGVYFKDLTNIVDIVLRILMYFTGIFFNIITRIPAPFDIWTLRLNPLATIIVSARNALLYDQPIHVGLIGIWMLISIVVGILGTILVYKRENDYAKVV